LARRRFFVDAVSGGTAELRGDDAHHLARVLRAEPGQQYEICDQHSVWLAEIVEAAPDRIIFRTVEELKPPPLPVRIAIYAALVKFDRFEWMIEKAAELGVERIIPVEAARSEKGLLQASLKRTERWSRIAREASRQSRRVQPPEIELAISFAAALGCDTPLRYFLEEETAPTLLRVLPAERGPSDSVAVLVGPEGGWTDREREHAAARGWEAVSLAPTILRAETAAIAAAAILINAWIAAPIQ
jgi:16S rRNA (uracil1498-N3)-methyltransferase